MIFKLRREAVEHYVRVSIFAGPAEGQLQLGGQVMLSGDEYKAFAAALIAGAEFNRALTVIEEPPHPLTVIEKSPR